MKFKTQGVKFLAGEKDKLAEGEFLVYPSTFIREPDSYGDVVAKGAFADTIKAWGESGNLLSGYYGHRMDDPDYNIAWAKEMGEDDHGWWVRGEFDLESPKGQQVYRLVKAGRLSQLSFAFDVLDEAQIKLDDGRKVNELRKLHVHEFSFVPVGANRDTSVEAVKSAVAALDVKAGRVLAQKHIDSLRDAHEAIGHVLAAAEGPDEGKTSGTVEGKSPAADEGADGVKSAADDEVTSGQPSVFDAFDLALMVRERTN